MTGLPAFGQADGSVRGTLKDTAAHVPVADATVTVFDVRDSSGVVAEWLSRKTRNLILSRASVRIWPTSLFLPLDAVHNHRNYVSYFLTGTVLVVSRFLVPSRL